MRRGVCIQRDYCPLCFRGGACADRVPLDSSRINEEQRECSRIFGGLPLLDLEMPGGRCHRACRLVCMVCGAAMAFSCEREFEDALDLVDRHEEEVLEMQSEVLEGLQGFGRSLGEKMLEDLERRFVRKLRRMGMAWHPRWGKLVHSRCLKPTPCGCLVPVGVSACPKHKRRLVPAKIQSTSPIKKAPSPMKKQKRDEQVILVVTTGSASKPITMVKATWLKQSAPTVSVHPPPVRPQPPPATKAPLPKPPVPKPNPRLEAAAKGSGKLDAWSVKQAEKPAETAQRRDRSFSMSRHERDFDQFQHGYLRKNGIDMYRFPDGTEVKVYSNVNELTEDGQLRASTPPTVVGEGVEPEVVAVHATRPQKQPAKANPRLQTAAKGSKRLDAFFSKRG